MESHMKIVVEIVEVTIYDFFQIGKNIILNIGIEVIKVGSVGRKRSFVKNEYASLIS